MEGLTSPAKEVSTGSGSTIDPTAGSFFADGFHREQMVLSFQAQELAREDVQEAQLPAVLIDVEVRHRPYERIPRVKDALLAHFVLWWSGMLVPLQPDQSHGSSFPSGACGP